MDDKANNMLAFAGVLVTLIAGFGSLSVKPAWINAIEAIASIVFVSCLGVLIASFCFGLMAHQTRSYTIVPDPPILVIEGEKLNVDEIHQALSDAYTLATEENMKKNERKVYNLKIASRLVFVSLVLFSVFAILTMTK